MTRPTISIVTPSYNQALFLEATIRSVLLQRYPALEYIVLDGASTDGSVDIIKRYAKYLAHWQSQSDGGHAAAVADGLARTSGEIMAFLNSDDVLLPGALDAVAHFFATHPTVDAIYGHRVVIDSEGFVTHIWRLPPHSNYLMQRWDLIPQETCFWRRRLFEKAGNIDPTCKFALDYDLFVRYMRAGLFVRLDRFIGAFRMHDHSKTTVDLATIGKQEIDKIQRTYGIRVSSTEQIVGEVFSAYVQWQSRRYAAGKGRRRAGAPQLSGYHVNQLWGNLLSSGEPISFNRG